MKHRSAMTEALACESLICIQSDRYVLFKIVVGTIWPMLMLVLKDRLCVRAILLNRWLEI